MNYRHAFHAGNFADLVKHAALTTLLRLLTASKESLVLIDTHAGAGLYDLTGDMAARSGEGEAGIGRLMGQAKTPAEFDALKAAVRRLNPDGGHRLYPGSPWLAANALRPCDRLVACEMREDDGAGLKTALKGSRTPLDIVIGDGFATAQARAGAKGRLCLLIDPPFERSDDYDQIVRTLGGVLRKAPSAVVMVWTPLKDLETFDRLLRGIEDLGPPPVLVVEARLRPLSDPMRMNGCALVVVDPPPGFEAPVRAVADWVVSQLGEADGEARVWTL
ncbi:MAG: 23S rRNA (adenine(2030)-N(6))-methyltransferase RlmJ [Caulobacteraceae bacterium]|nr:23S rRNA (adenine(2030)-N(6))-methyltransferase RlmJ [Caulobacteraceae bacterium]